MILRSKKEEAKGDWRKLHNEELHDLCLFADITGVGRMGEACGSSTIYTGFWLENLKERDFLDDLGIEGRILLKWVSMQDGNVYTGLMWLRTEATGTQKQGNALIRELCPLNVTTKAVRTCVFKSFLPSTRK
jgi:hypothetical protein